MYWCRRVILSLIPAVSRNTEVLLVQTEDMEFDYFSVEAILAENQKVQCTFKQGIPGMGHIGGGSERDVGLPVAGWTFRQTSYRSHP
jgi:hypothetical protein